MAKKAGSKAIRLTAKQVWDKARRATIKRFKADYKEPAKCGRCGGEPGDPGCGKVIHGTMNTYLDEELEKFYPREDVCERCGVHVGWVVAPMGEVFALGKCDDCLDKEDEEDNGG